MHRFLLLIWLLGMFAMTAWSQEAADVEAEEADQSEPELVPATEAAVEVDEQEDIVIDDEYYQDVDDKDFRPSEDIPADQSIAFPTDI